MESLTERKVVIEDMYSGFLHILPQDIGDNIRQVIRGNRLFLITQFDNPFGYLAHRLFIQVDAQCVEVFADIGLADILPSAYSRTRPKRSGNRSL